MSSRTDNINAECPQCPSEQSVFLIQYQPAAIWSAVPRRSLNKQFVFGCQGPKRKVLANTEQRMLSWDRRHYMEN